jgi:hypothetical protein
MNLNLNGRIEYYLKDSWMVFIKDPEWDFVAMRGFQSQWKIKVVSDFATRQNEIEKVLGKIVLSESPKCFKSVNFALAVPASRPWQVSCQRIPYSFRREYNFHILFVSKTVIVSAPPGKGISRLAMPFDDPAYPY